MTDTTDIKALREKWEYRIDICSETSPWVDVTPVELRGLLDQLEAERQQREAAEKARVRIDGRNAELNSTLERWSVERAENANEIEALRAALRGEQEPVCWIDPCELHDIKHGHSSKVIPSKELDGDIPLFANPPKPVAVLPKRHLGVIQNGKAVMIPYSGGHWLNKTAVIETLELAGIVVKDGE